MNDAGTDSTGRPVDEKLTTGDTLVGRVISGAYRVESLVGSGGMGRVYLAQRLSLAKTVALKIIHPHLLSHPSSIARFYREVRATSRLNHPNTVAVIDFGRTDDGLLFLVMEYLRGRDLAQLLYEEGPLPISRVIAIARQIAAALAEAHEHGVVHRDLKPENVHVEQLRTDDDLVKVVDFGLARMLDSPDSNVTSPGIVCGTPEYMAPEQCAGGEADTRSDLYALGVVLYQMLTGKLPIEGPNAAKTMLFHLTKEPPSPREVAPDRGITEQLDAVVMRALSKSREARFQTAIDLGAALRDAWRASPRPRRVSFGASIGVAQLCPACRTKNEPGARYCETCGARMSRTASGPPSESVIPWEPALVGRDGEIAWIEDLRASAQHEPVAIVVSGSVGVGKTRLLAEVAQRARASGDLVVEARPHPSGAPVRYHAIRKLLAGLGVPDGPLTWIDALEQAKRPSGFARVGLREIMEPTGVAHLDREARAAVAAIALSWAIERARVEASAPRVVLLVDDLNRAHDSSRSALRYFASRFASSKSPIVLVAASSLDAPDVLGSAVSRVNLRGLPVALASTLVGDHAPWSEAGSGELVPMAAIECARLGSEAKQHIGAPLGDVVALHVARLSPTARQVLQAAAVVGETAPTEDVRALLEGDLDVAAGLAELEQRGLAREVGGEVQLWHPLVRDVAEATTPAARCRELHGRRLEWLSERGETSVEIRAHHAWQAEDAFGALLLLERAGDAAAKARRDAEAATWLRRGLDLARAETARGEMDSAGRAAQVFSRKLGEVLLALGDVAEADGVLREAFGLGEPTKAERVRMLVLLARVSLARGRMEEAHRHLHEALQSTEVVERSVLANVWDAAADVWGADGRRSEAIEAVRRAASLLVATPDAAELRAHMLMRAASLHEAEGDREGALGALALAEDAAKSAAMPVCAAEICATRAALLESSGDVAGAARQYAAAITLAEDGGDPVRRERYAAALERYSPTP